MAASPAGCPKVPGGCFRGFVKQRCDNPINSCFMSVFECTMTLRNARPQSGRQNSRSIRQLLGFAYGVKPDLAPNSLATGGRLEKQCSPGDARSTPDQIAIRNTLRKNVYSWNNLVTKCPRSAKSCHGATKNTMFGHQNLRGENFLKSVDTGDGLRIIAT